MSLDSQTLQQVKDGLLRCGPMHSQQGLSAVFVDKRVAPWRNLIPEASSPAERTDRLIERLHDSYDQHDQNALVLFCTVLADNTDPAVACHDRLKQLAALVQREVDRSRNIPDARQTWPVGRRLTTSISLAVAVLGILIVTALILRGLSDGASTRSRSSSPSPPLTNSALCPPPAVHAATDDFDTMIVKIEGGTFTMGDGSDQAEKNAVDVAPFYIDRFEVTNQQYQQFVADAEYNPPSGWKGTAFPTGHAFKPVTGVSWEDARAYCVWKGKRLPTEAEWEFACRSHEQLAFPWGNEADAAQGNSHLSTCEDVLSVGSYSPHGDTSDGVADMIGNADEWTSSLAWPYPYDASDGREDPASSGEDRVARGGSFRTTLRSCAQRTFTPAILANDETGFRCVRSVDEGAE